MELTPREKDKLLILLSFLKNKLAEIDIQGGTGSSPGLPILFITRLSAFKQKAFLVQK